MLEDCLNDWDAGALEALDVLLGGWLSLNIIKQSTRSCVGLYILGLAYNVPVENPTR